MTEKSTSAPSPPWWGRIETLWLTAPALCALLYTLCLPIAPNDFWYHARAGWFIATTGHIPTTNLFSAGVAASTPYYYQSWLAELLIFRVLEQGLAWIIVLRALCVAAAIGLVTAVAYRRCLAGHVPVSAAAKWAAAGALATLGMSANNMDIRPQTFSLVFFAALVWMVLEWPAANARTRGFLSLGLIFLFILWANTHGAFPAGLVVLGATGIGAAFFHKKRDFSLLGIALLCALAVLINPRGFAIYRYVLMLAKLPIGRQFIAEWQPPTFGEWHSGFFLLSPLAPLLLAAIARRKTGIWAVSGGQWLAAAALFLMATGAVRAIIWFSLFYAIILAETGAAAFAPRHQKSTPNLAAARFINAALLLLFVLAPLPLLPWFKPHLPWPPEFRARFAPTPARLFPGEPPLLLENTTPVETVELLAQKPPRGRLFCDMVFGSYMTWALYPRLKPFAEPRVELYSTQFWLRYASLCRGPKNASAQLEKDGFTQALLDPQPQNQRELVRRLGKSPRWELVLKRGPAILFGRRETPGVQ